MKRMMVTCTDDSVAIQQSAHQPTCITEFLSPLWSESRLGASVGEKPLFITLHHEHLPCIEQIYKSSLQPPDLLSLLFRWWQKEERAREREALGWLALSQSIRSLSLCPTEGHTGHTGTTSPQTLLTHSDISFQPVFPSLELSKPLWTVASQWRGILRSVVLVLPE